MCCNNIHELKKELQCRLYIDSSKIKFKAVLLHNGKDVLSIPLGHAVHMKGTYKNLQV
jgi:hypothetical protein